MVEVSNSPLFEEKLKKLKDPVLKSRIKKQIEKMTHNPEIGKPMMYGRKGTRELYISSFRLSYVHLQEENKIVIFDIYHKDEQ